MANQKQDGSNVINAEYSTGRCRTQCEQCFVNFGQQGLATCKSIVNPGKEKLLNWLEAESKRFGRYVPPAPIPAGTKTARDSEPLLRKITATGKGFWNIPTQGSWENWVVQKAAAKKKQKILVKGLEDMGPFPCFLRVSSMSDSSWAPFEWLEAVQGAWGDHCFFNSAIRSINRAKTSHPGVMDRYHKLVVTTNPGHQTQMKMRPATSRIIDPGERARAALRWTKAHKKGPAGTMGPARNRRRDFFHPETLSDIGLEGYEDIIKFCRLRALPTMWPRLDTDNPIVVTQMRFKGLDHVVEFSRRYGLGIEVHTPAAKNGKLPPSIDRALAPFRAKGYDVPLVIDNSLPAKQVLLWTDKKDARNASPFAGEASVYMWENSFFRPVNIEAFDGWDYVCDRVHGACENCGLCCSLDGTEKNWTNPLNVAPNGQLLPPIPGPDGGFYLGTNNPDTGDGFQELLEQAGQAGEFRRNPSEPADPAWCMDAFSAVAVYTDKDQTIDADWCEGWNTHESSATLTAFCVWSLMVHAKSDGMSFNRAQEWISDMVVEATDDESNILDGVGDVWGMWNDDSEWNDQFGSTEG